MSSILSSVYGWTDIEPESPYPQFFQNFIERLGGACLPGSYLVDALPAMKYLPAWVARWKREGLAWHDRHSQILKGFNAGIREKMVSSMSDSCLCGKKSHNDVADCTGNGG